MTVEVIFDARKSFERDIREFCQEKQYAFKKWGGNDTDYDIFLSSTEEYQHLFLNFYTKTQNAIKIARTDTYDVSESKIDKIKIYVYDRNYLQFIQSFANSIDKKDYTGNIQIVIKDV